MKNLFLFCLAALLATQFLYAQKTLVPGKIITLTGDTIAGNVDNKDWETNPVSVKFIASDGVSKTYTPLDIRGFVINPDLIYLAKHLSMDVSNTKVADLMRNDRIQIVRDTAIFVKLVVKGAVSLYFTKDRDDKEHFWIQKGGDSIIELRLERKVVMMQDHALSATTNIATSKPYLLMLEGTMNDCPAIQKDISSTSFDLKSFTGIVARYNSCIDPTAVQTVKEPRKLKVRFGAIAGGSYLKLDFTGDDQNPLAGANYSGKVTWEAGLLMKMILPYLHGSWIIYNDLVFRPYSTSTTDTSYLFYIPGYKAIETTTFDMFYIRLNTMIRYQYQGWKVKPFFNIGISNSYALQNKNTLVREKHIGGGGNVTTETGKAIDDPRAYEIGLPVGIGVSYKDFSLEFRYEWSNGMSSSEGLQSNVNSFSLLFSYTLFESR
jgi:hypothetical protein